MGEVKGDGVVIGDGEVREMWLSHRWGDITGGGVRNRLEHGTSTPEGEEVILKELVLGVEQGEILLLDWSTWSGWLVRLTPLVLIPLALALFFLYLNQLWFVLSQFLSQHRDLRSQPITVFVLMSSTCKTPSFLLDFDLVGCIFDILFQLRYTSQSYIFRDLWPLWFSLLLSATLKPFASWCALPVLISPLVHPLSRQF